MTFGVLFGAAFLTLLGYSAPAQLPQRLCQLGARHGGGRAARRVRELRGADRQGALQRRPARGIDALRHGGFADAECRRPHHAVQHPAVLHGRDQDRAQPHRHPACRAGPVPLPAGARAAGRRRRPRALLAARSGCTAGPRGAGAGFDALCDRLRQEPLVHRLHDSAVDAAGRISRRRGGDAPAQRFAARRAVRFPAAVHDIARRHIPAGADRLRCRGRRRAAQRRPRAGLRDGARLHARHLQHLFVLYRGGRDLAARRFAARRRDRRRRHRRRMGRGCVP